MKSSFLPTSLPTKSTATTDLHEAIRQRAEEIYVRNGRVPGHDLENWTLAEQEIEREFKGPQRRTAVIVKVDGVQYVGEYHPERSQGYVPGEFEPGSVVRVRVEGDKMFLKRSDGRELETTIVKTIG